MTRTLSTRRYVTIASAAAHSAIAVCVSTIMRRRSMRSASAPPTNPKTANGV